jgi:hypothetical protein
MEAGRRYCAYVATTVLRLRKFTGELNLTRKLNALPRRAPVSTTCGGFTIFDTM